LLLKLLQKEAWASVKALPADSQLTYQLRLRPSLNVHVLLPGLDTEVSIPFKV
jgi:hypothetical protein